MENKLLQQFLIPLLALISLIYAIQALGKQPDTILSEVYHQQRDSKGEHSLEVGNFSLYFTKKPKINLLKIDQKNSYEERTFFFPQVLLKGKELKAAIEKMSKKYDHYMIHITLVKEPMVGMQMTIRYDRHKIALVYEECESIGLQNGIVFRLYNKEVIKKLRLHKNKPVLTVASALKSEQNLINLRYLW